MAANANPHRGEVAVTLAGQEYRARPSYTAVLAWEDGTGRTSTELLYRFASGIFTLKEITTVLHAALAAGGTVMPPEQVGELVLQEGQTEVLAPCGTLLRNALTGGKAPRPGEGGPAEPDAPRSAG